MNYKFTYKDKNKVEILQVNETVTRNRFNIGTGIKPPVSGIISPYEGHKNPIPRSSEGYRYRDFYERAAQRQPSPVDIVAQKIASRTPDINIGLTEARRIANEHRAYDNYIMAGKNYSQPLDDIRNMRLSQINGGLIDNQRNLERALQGDYGYRQDLGYHRTSEPVLHSNYGYVYTPPEHPFNVGNFDTVAKPTLRRYSGIANQSIAYTPRVGFTRNELFDSENDIMNRYIDELNKPYQGWWNSLLHPPQDSGSSVDFIRGLFSKQSSALFAGSVGLHFASSLALQPLKELTKLNLDPAIQFQKETILAANPLGLGKGIVGYSHLPHFQNLIKKMSLSYSQNPVELMQSARQLAQAGMSGKEIIGILPPSLKFSEMTAGEVGVLESSNIARMLVRKFRIEPTEQALTTAFSQMFQADQATSLSVEDMAIALNSLSSAPLEFKSTQLPEYLATIGMLRDMGQMPAQAAATTAGFMRSISKLGVTELRGEQKIGLAGLFEEMGISRRTRPHYRDFAYYSYFGTDFTKQFSVTEENLSKYKGMGKQVGDLIPIPEIIEKVSGQLTYKRDAKGNLVKDETGKPVPLSEFERSAVMSQLGFSSQFKNVIFGYQQMQEGQSAVWNEDLKSWVAEGKLLARGYNDIIKEITSSTKALDIGFKNMSGTLIQVSNRLESSKEALITTLGESLLPAKTQSTEMLLGISNMANAYLENKPALTSHIAGGLEGFSKGIGLAKSATDFAGSGLMALAMIKTLSTRYMTQDEIIAGNMEALRAKEAMMLINPDRAASMTAVPYNTGSITWNKSALRFGGYVGGGLISAAKGMATGYSTYSTGALLGRSKASNIAISGLAGLTSGGLSMAGVSMMMKGKDMVNITKGLQVKGTTAGMMAMGASILPDISNRLMALGYDVQYTKQLTTMKNYSNNQIYGAIGFYSGLDEPQKEILSNILGIPKAQLETMSVKGKLMDKLAATNFGNTIFSDSFRDNFERLRELYPEFKGMTDIRERTLKDFEPITKNINGRRMFTPAAQAAISWRGGGDFALGMSQDFAGANFKEIRDKRTIGKYWKGLSYEERAVYAGHAPNGWLASAGGAAGGLSLASLGLWIAGLAGASLSGGLSLAVLGGAAALGGVGAYSSTRQKKPKVIYEALGGGTGQYLDGRELSVSQVQYYSGISANPETLTDYEQNMKIIQSGAETVDALDTINQNLVNFMKALFSAGSSGKNQITVNQIFKSADRELLKQQAYQMGDIISKNMETIKSRSFSELNLVEVSR